MAQTYHIKDLTNNADTNTATPPQGAPEGMQRTAVNNTMREMMGAIRGDWDGSAPSGGSQWRDVSGGNLVSRVSASQLTIGVLDLTSSFPIGRKVKLTYPTGNSGYAFVSAVSFGGGDTTITVADFDDASPDDEVRAGITNCLMASGFGDIADHGIGQAAYESMTEASVTAAYTAADSAITAAYIAADAAISLAGNQFEEAAAQNRTTGFGVITGLTDHQFSTVPDGVDEYILDVVITLNVTTAPTGVALNFNTGVTNGQSVLFTSGVLPVSTGDNQRFSLGKRKIIPPNGHAFWSVILSLTGTGDVDVRAHLNSFNGLEVVESYAKLTLA
jgi:hypothetical protein